MAATASAISNSLIDLGNNTGASGIATGSDGFKSDFGGATADTGVAAAAGFDNGGAGTLSAKSTFADCAGGGGADNDN